MDNRAFSYDVIAFENTKENASTVSIQEHSSFSGALGVWRCNSIQSLHHILAVNTPYTKVMAHYYLQWNLP